MEYRLNGTPLPPLDLEMRDHDLRTVTYDSHELDEHRSVEIASLRLDDDVEDTDDDVVSTWSTEGRTIVEAIDDQGLTYKQYSWSGV